jgi:hypothetical protein
MTAKKTDELFSLYKQFAESQRRQQLTVVIILSAVIAVATALYTWITWESVAARREANELQKQLIELQRAIPPSKTALAPRSNARRAVQATAEPHRAPRPTLPNGHESPGSQHTAIDGEAPSAAGNDSPSSPRTWSTRSVMLDRPGRR